MRIRPALLFLLPVVALACAPSEEDEDIGTTTEEMKVCPAAGTLEGVDVSHYDNTIDWAKVAGAGRTFGFVKATEGTSFVDPKFATNWADMKANKIVRSAYHFFHADIDPIAQADHFLQTMGPLEAGDLPPVLDLETTNGQSGSTITKNAVAWLDHVAMMTGVKPILYTSPSFVTGTMGSPAGLDTKALLWIANWQVSCPDVPAPFTSWPFWQYSDSGSVNGIPTAVDLDRFNGSMSELQALTVGGSSSSSSSSSSGATVSAASASSSSSTSGATTSSGGGGAGGEDSTPDGPEPTGAGGAGSTGSGNVILGPGLQGGSGAPHSKGCACSLETTQGGDAPRASLGLLLGLLAFARRSSSRRAHRA